MRYVTGTTLENLLSIIKEGSINPKPPHRVWKDHSKNYVYMIPKKTATETLSNGTTVNKSVAQAFRMADFAIKELGHTKRVVLELGGLDDYYITADEDNRDINAVKYPFNISTVFIKNIYIDSEDYSSKINSYSKLLKICQDFLTSNQLTDDSEMNAAFSELIEDAKSDEEVSDFIEIYSLENKDFMSTLTELSVIIQGNANYNEYSVEEFTNSFVDLVQ